MLFLCPRTQAYSWGSKTLIAGLRGSGPTQHPEAELWYGAHPAAPAEVDGVPLTEIIAADPDYHLGAQVRAHFGDRLPFLLKILAAAEPLSLQAHPSLQQARDGFRRENDQGIDLRAWNRNYRDDNHKPELIVALTPFHAMAGFRPLADTLELFDVLNCPALDRYVGMADRNGAEDANLRALFTTWITIPATVRKQLIDDIVTAARQVVAERTVAQWKLEALENIIELDAHYPGDVGVLGALLLNHVILQPGEGIYLDAGNLHAYCYGMGVEVMANSDNVLRGGLTSKHVDVPELVRVLKFDSLAHPRIGCHAGLFDVPNKEFVLRMIDVAGEWQAEVPGPRVVLCTAGAVTITVGDSVQELTPTQSVWIAAGEPAAMTVTGTGQVFVVGVDA
ncbi:MAG: mannose-6-phosphate isomerase, class I [Corynebacterium sp.]|nr:mannose-6-phosphate isomerase, class I [Corynebacterium sp.]